MRIVFEQIDKSSLYDSIYSQIALALVEGRLQPHDKVRIRAIAEQLGVSVTPVRDAVLRLVREGALELRGHKDVRVAAMNLEQFEEIRVIRLRLEGLAAALAASRINEKQENDLAEILEQNEKARRDGNNVEAVRLNRLFHYRIAEYSGLPRLAEMIDGFWLRMGPVIASVYETGGPSMISFHHDIMDALRNRDGVSAEAAICADINSAAAVIRTSGLLAEDASGTDTDTVLPGTA